jgi:type II restriction/modification system DNA methylase subunit YeeA
MLFLARCLDLYLRVGGKLGFLIPFTVFKTQAGAGFRSFLARKTKVHIIHDLVTLYPFEGATNRTAAIVVEKVGEVDPERLPDEKIKAIHKEALAKAFEGNMKGMEHVIWVNPSGRAIPTDKPLEEVLKETRRYNAVMIPLEPKKPESPWMQVTHEVIEATKKLLTGPQHYEAHTGVYVGLNQVYFIEVKSTTPDGRLIITNPPEPGQKKKVRQAEATIEPNSVYPLIRGRNVKRWNVEFKGKYIVVPHDSKTAKPLSEVELKVKLPLTYQYLNTYKSELEDRAIHKLWGKGNPFYTVYDIGRYTFAPYKIAWGEISGAITGKATTFKCAVLEPINNKPVIPDHTVNFIGVDNVDEAYYIAGFLNSTITRTIIASYTYELRQETHIADVIKIPKFDPKNETHRKIAQLSKRAHELAKCIYAEEAQPMRRVLKPRRNLRGLKETGSSCSRSSSDYQKTISKS